VLKHAGLQLNKLKHVALLDNRAVLVTHAAAAATRVNQHLYVQRRHVTDKALCASVSGAKNGSHRMTRVPRRLQGVKRQKVDVVGLDVFASHFVDSCLMRQERERESAKQRRVAVLQRGRNMAIKRCAEAGNKRRVALPEESQSA
jgi:hypothetical protein